MYTTIQTVRTMSGFDNESNITDPNIKSKIIRACAMVDSALGLIYTLPIKYRYMNTLTFSGAVTGAGTMVIVINGITYNLDLATGESLDTIADNFRLLVEGSTDFVSDDFGLGEEVSIISLSNSDNKSTAFAEVNITAAPTTVGIIATIGGRIQRYPQTLDQIVAEIATALLFIDEYGIEAQNIGKDGENRMDRVNETLRKLQGVDESGQSIKIFDDITNIELSTSSVLHPESYPNDTSDTDVTDSTSPKAFINKVF